MTNVAGKTCGATVATTLQTNVRELLAMARQAYSKRGVAQGKKAALTKECVEPPHASCDDPRQGLLDRALLVVAWSSGGRRRSDVVDATTGIVPKIGVRAHVFNLLRSKTSQSGGQRSDSNKPIALGDASVLQVRLSRSVIGNGPTSRRIRRGDRVAEPLSPAAVRDTFSRRELRRPA